MLSCLWDDAYKRTLAANRNILSFIVKDHSKNESESLVSGKGSFICTIPQTG